MKELVLISSKKCKQTQSQAGHYKSGCIEFEIAFQIQQHLSGSEGSLHFLCFQINCISQQKLSFQPNYIPFTEKASWRRSPPLSLSFPLYFLWGFYFKIQYKCVCTMYEYLTNLLINLIKNRSCVLYLERMAIELRKLTPNVNWNLINKKNGGNVYKTWI